MIRASFLLLAAMVGKAGMGSFSSRDRPVTGSNRTGGGASPIAQGVVGAAACGFAAIPLAVVLTLIGAIFGDMDGLGEIVLGFVLYAMFGAFIGWAMGFLVGLPLYLLLNRVGALRLDVFMLLGAAGGFAVFALWIGAEHVGDAWPFALGFVMCGVCSALAFWLGAKKARA